MKYKLPSWINDFIENQLLKDKDLKNESEQKTLLYSLGRLPLRYIQKFVKIPSQDEPERYLTENNVGGFPDELMMDIHTAQGVQEILSNIFYKRPEKPLRFVPVWKPLEMENRIHSRNWKNDQWGVGSHTGCDIYVLYINVKMGLNEYEHALKGALATCGALQSRDDGMWGGSENEPYQRINITMKILSKVHYAQEFYLPFSDKVIDDILEHFRSASTDLEICTIIDILFCLKYASKITDHRRKEIADCAYDLFSMLNKTRCKPAPNMGLIQGTIRRAALLCGLDKKLAWPAKTYSFPPS